MACGRFHISYYVYPPNLDACETKQGIYIGWGGMLLVNPLFVVFVRGEVLGALMFL